MARAGADHHGSHGEAEPVTPIQLATVGTGSVSRPIVLINYPGGVLDSGLDGVGSDNILKLDIKVNAMTSGICLSVKQRLRRAEAAWLHIEVPEEQLTSIKWLTQCCRTAQRAGVPWSMLIHITAPWVPHSK